MSLSENKITEKALSDQISATISQGKLFDLHTIGNKRVEIGFTAQEVSSDGGLRSQKLLVLKQNVMQHFLCQPVPVVPAFSGYSGQTDPLFR